MKKRLLNQFWPPYLSQLPFSALFFLWFVPREESSSGRFFIWCFDTVNWFQRARVISCVSCLCADSHGGRGKILHLFKLKI